MLKHVIFVTLPPEFCSVIIFGFMSSDIIFSWLVPFKSTSDFQLRSETSSLTSGDTQHFKHSHHNVSGSETEKLC